MFDVQKFLPLFIAGGSPSSDTLRHYQTEIHNFNLWCEQQNLQPADVTELDARQYIHFLTSKNYSPASIKIKSAAIKNYYKIAVQLQIVNHNPFDNLKTKTPTYDDTDFDFLSLDELKTLCQTAQNQPEPYQSRNLAIIMLMATEGLRTVEIHRLSDEDINFKRSTIFVHGKGHNDFIYPCQDTMSVLDKYISQRTAPTKDSNGTPTFISFTQKFYGQRISRNGIRSIVNQLLINAELKTSGNSCHMLRHSCGTNLYAETKDLRLVQETLRQRTPEMAARYAHVNTRLNDRTTSRISPLQKK